MISYRRVQRERESDELLYTVLVTRYGPQSVASASGQSSRLDLKDKRTSDSVRIASFHREIFAEQYGQAGYIIEMVRSRLIDT